MDKSVQWCFYEVFTTLFSVVSIPRQQENGKRFKQEKTNAYLGKRSWNVGNRRQVKTERLCILNKSAHKKELENVSPSSLYLMSIFY